MRRTPLLLLSIAALLALAACTAAPEATDVEPASTPKMFVARTPTPIPTPDRGETHPGQVARLCVDALGDSAQATAYDLEQVGLTFNGDDTFTVRWAYDTGVDYSPTDNVEYSIGLKPLSGENGYTDLTTFIGGGERISTTIWGGPLDVGKSDLNDYSYDVGTGYAAFTYQTKYIEQLGPSFTWSAHVVYNQNGHDECGTTEQTLDWDTGWLVYE
ncbi:hypothetical protein [Leifsonia sp. Leaf264]|uniref:hypothetical protein n=1 Tax=Leifsonia sp. Leaf264 TaxID=1736314 RepID=UPI0006FE81F7|nr:hypothetical protein [Leifsonia sp. Leaf264]KQO98402.1 hypothetical protein ASF30_10095 [Leifsonia sp. Leaf264]